MVEIAIAEAEAKEILPKESMWSLQRVLYYEKDDLKKVTSILQKLVTHYPKWTYWKQLGGMYGSQERETDQLVATEMVYMNDQLTTESQVMSMAYMYLGAEVPYRAARIIDKGMQDKIIEKNAKNFEELGQAWWQVKYSRALLLFTWIWVRTSRRIKHRRKQLRKARLKMRQLTMPPWVVR